MNLIFDYVIKQIVVSHPNKPGQQEKDTSKYVMNCLAVCKKFRNQKVHIIYQNDGRSSDEFLRDAVIDVVTKDKLNSQIANIPDHRYTLSQDEMAKLKEYGADKDDLTLLPSCQLVDYKLPVPMCMKYTTALGGHNAGEFVKKPNSEFVKLFTGFQVLCQTFGEANEFLSGQRPEDVAEGRIRNMISVLDAQKKGAIFDPNDLRTYGLTAEKGMDIPTPDELMAAEDSPL